MKAGEFQIVLSLQIRSDFLHVKIEVKLKGGGDKKEAREVLKAFRLCSFITKKKKEKRGTFSPL